MLLAKIWSIFVTFWYVLVIKPTYNISTKRFSRKLTAAIWRAFQLIKWTKNMFCSKKRTIINTQVPSNWVWNELIEYFCMHIHYLRNHLWLRPFSHILHKIFVISLFSHCSYNYNILVNICIEPNERPKYLVF